MLLESKFALVTGGTSGIGAAIVREFAAQGARVAFVGRNRDKGAQIAEETGAAFYYGDVADAATPERLVEQARRELGGLNVLVNNAGIIFRKTVEELSLDEWEQMFAVNTRAVFLFSRAVIPIFRAQGGGVILTVASSAAIGASPGYAGYAASKAAVVQLTRNMTRDHAREGIRTLSLCPADVDTPMLDEEARQLGMDPAEYRRGIPDEYPLGRMGTPEEIARAATFLVSDQCTFITGLPLVIDGGLRA